MRFKGCKKREKNKHIYLSQLASSPDYIQNPGLLETFPDEIVLHRVNIKICMFLSLNMNYVKHFLFD